MNKEMAMWILIIILSVCNVIFIGLFFNSSKEIEELNNKVSEKEKIIKELKLAKKVWFKKQLQRQQEEWLKIPAPY